MNTSKALGTPTLNPSPQGGGKPVGIIEPKRLPPPSGEATRVGVSLIHVFQEARS